MEIKEAREKENPTRSRSDVRKMNVVVFGGAGFLGSYVADALSEDGHFVTIFDIKKSDYLKDNQKMIIGDITDQSQVEKAVEGMDVVYNFAALADIDIAKDKAIDAVKINILGNTYALEAARKAGVRRFVYASSVYVYSRFGAFYSDSKLAAEKFTENYQRQFDLPFTILRYGSLYGPARSKHLSSVNKHIEQAIKNKKISYRGTGEEVREYIHVKDAARLSVDILGPEYKNQRILITGQQALTSRELLTMIKEILNHDIEIEFLNSGNREHYHMTGYSFQPELARKLIPQTSIDIGQGLLDLISETHRLANPDAYEEHIKHLPEE